MKICTGGAANAALSVCRRAEQIMTISITARGEKPRNMRRTVTASTSRRAVY